MKILDTSPRSYRLTECLVCGAPLRGRRDKKYCSLSCKNAYHTRRRIEQQPVVATIDRLLHRNREILVELWEEAQNRKFIVPRSRLQRKGFKFRHFTSTYVNKAGKLYHYVYDFSWMAFSSGDILVVKRS
ncbi:MAG: hypothetical protein R3330_07075 [Saprospiraceae bacterium]|nr:hypothetical protein [Saprospiraceae bacterium]